MIFDFNKQSLGNSQYAKLYIPIVYETLLQLTLHKIMQQHMKY